MTRIKNTFISSRLNTDLDERLVPNGEYVHAENIRVSNSEGSDVGAIENSLGNRQLTQIELGTNPFTIGSYSDEFEEKIYWFVTSDTGNYVLEWDNINQVASKVLEDTRSGDNNILSFDKDYLITGINVLIDSDNGERFLLWTDNLNPPRMINIERSKAYGTNGFGQDEISVIKKPPLFSPDITLTDTSTNEENNIEEKFLAFAYRYRYLDGEYSAFSPFTPYAFFPEFFSFDYAVATNESMINRYNAVDIQFNTGSKLVVAIDLLFKESGSNNVYLIETFNKEDKGWNDNQEVNFLFSNNKLYRILPERQLERLYDNVPRIAKAQDLISNRLVYGNYLENYDLVRSNGEDINLDYRVNVKSESVTEGTPVSTMRSNRDYEVGIVYVDDYGRMTTVLTSEYNTAYIKNEESINKNQLQVTINSRAPEFAKYYRFFIKQSKTDYDTIVPTVFYADGVYRWVKLEGGDQNKIEEGEFLVVKSDSSELLETVEYVKVLEIAEKERNFLEPEDTDPDVTVHQLPGIYMKIKPTGFTMNPADVKYYEFEGDGFKSRNTANALGNNVSYIEDAIYNGTSGNDDLSVSGTYTANEDKRYIVEIFSTGTPDRYRRSSDNGATWNDNSGNGFPITAGSPTNIGDGIMITFDTSTGHDVGDQWIISGRSSEEIDELMHNGGDVSSIRRHAWVPYVGKPPEDEGIEAGSTITIYYKEQLRGGDTVFREYEQSFITTNFYQNIEEWFYGDEIITQLEYPTSLDRAFFRRTADMDTDNEKIDPNGDLTMFFITENGYTGGERLNPQSRLLISELRNIILFETKPAEDNTDIFFEIGQTYEVLNEYHLGISGDQNQTATQPTVIVLPVFNAFAWGNGFESYKIKDEFEARSMKLDTRPSGSIDNYRANRRISSLTYSEVYEQTTNYNALNEFNLFTANFKDLDDKHGSIQKLYARDTNLLVFQEDKILQVLYAKSLLYNADGTVNVVRTNEVLGQEVAYAGEYGISTNPESFAIYGNWIWFTDTKRGAVMRLGGDGLFEISRYGMQDFFRDEFIKAPYSKKLGGYDPYFDQYVLSAGDEEVPPILQTECGQQVIKYNQNSSFSYIFNLNDLGGDVTISYDTTGVVDIQAVFNGTTHSAIGISGTGDLTFTRDSLSETQVSVTVTPVDENVNYTLTNNCPIGTASRVVVIIVNDEDDTGKTMTSRYKWNSSAYYSEIPTFQEDGITEFKTYNGFEGENRFPQDGATVEIQAFKDANNSGSFEIPRGERLGYLVSNIEYTEADINTILSGATYPTITVENEGGIPETHKASFTYNKVNQDDILYLIWDYVNKNEPPIAVDDSVTMFRGETIDIDVLANDSDPDGDPLEVIIVNNPLHGTSSVNPDQSIKYTHDKSFNLSDSLRYKLTDGLDESNIATVSITIENRAPIAVDDTAEVDRGESVIIDILANDSDPDGDPLEIIIMSEPQFGDIVLNPDQTVTYTHDDSNNQSDNFTYRLSDGLDFSNTATVTIEIIGEPPVAVDDYFMFNRGQSIALDVTANDSDPDGDVITPVIVTQPSFGTVSVNPNRTIQYIHNGSVNLQDSFTYKLTDGTYESNTATVTLEGFEVNNDTALVEQDDSRIIDVLANDIIPSNPYTMNLVPPNPSNGSASLTGTGNYKNILYTHNGNTATSDSVGYSVTKNSVTKSATLNIVISAWRQRSTTNVNPDGYWLDVNYASTLNRWIAVGLNNDGVSGMYSNNGRNWSAMQIGNNTVNWEGCGAGADEVGDLFLAARNGQNEAFATSRNGTTWVRRNAPQNRAWVDIAYGNDIAVAVAQNGSDNIAYSTDAGATWTMSTYQNGTDLLKVKFLGDGKFWAVGGHISNSPNNNLVQSSVDGSNWSAVSVGMESGRIVTDITYGDGVYVLVCDNYRGGLELSAPAIYRSTNGVNWTAVTMPGTETQEYFYSGVSYANGRFYASINNENTGSAIEAVLYSDDSINWQFQTAHFGEGWSAIDYGDNKFVVVSSDRLSNPTPDLKVMTKEWF